MEFSFLFNCLLATIVIGDSQESCIFDGLHKTSTFEVEICNKLLDKMSIIQKWQSKKECVAKIQKFLNKGVTKKMLELEVEKMKHLEIEKFYDIVELITAGGWDDSSINSLLTNINGYIQEYVGTLDSTVSAEMIKQLLLLIDFEWWKSEGKTGNISLLHKLNNVYFFILVKDDKSKELYKKWIARENKFCDAIVAAKLIEIFEEYNQNTSLHSSITEDDKFEIFDTVCLSENWNRRNIALVNVGEHTLTPVKCLKMALKMIFEKMPLLKDARNDAGWGIDDVLAEVNTFCWSVILSESSARGVQSTVERVFATVSIATELRLKPAVFWATATKTESEAYRPVAVGREKFYDYLKCFSEYLSDSTPRFRCIDDYNKYKLLYEVTKYFINFENMRARNPDGEIGKKTCAEQRKWTVDKLIEHGNESDWSGSKIRSGLQRELDRNGNHIGQLTPESEYCAELVRSFAPQA